MKKFEVDKQYMKYSIYVLITAVMITIFYRIINNAEFILGQIFEIIGNFFSIITPVTLAIFFSYILNRPMVRLQKWYLKIFKKRKGFLNNHARILSILTIYVIIFLFISMMANFILPQITENLTELIKDTPKYEKEVKKWIIGTKATLEKLNITITENQYENLFHLFDDFSKQALDIALLNLKAFTVSIMNFILAIIICFYLLKDKEFILQYIKELQEIFLPEKKVKSLRGYLKDIDCVLGQFMVGVLTDAFIVGIITTILMGVIGHRFSFLVGIFAGIMNVIPYFGPFMGAIFAGVLGLLQGPVKAITAFLVIIVFQQIDGNIMQPKIVGSKVGLNPVVVIIAVLIGGGYFGILGMALAVPIAATIKLFLTRFIEEKKSQKQKY